MAFGRLTMKWHLFCQNMESNLEKISNMFMTAACLHNYVIDNDSITSPTVSNRNYYDPLQWGVEALPNVGLGEENNGYLNNHMVILDNTPLAQHAFILNGIIERDLRRP